MSEETMQIKEAIEKTINESESPGLAMGIIYQTGENSTGLMFEMAVNSQHNQEIMEQEATNQGVMQVYSFDTLEDAMSIATMLGASENASSEEFNSDIPTKALLVVNNEIPHTVCVVADNTGENEATLAQTSTTQGVMQIYSVDTIADAIAISQMLNA